MSQERLDYLMLLYCEKDDDAKNLNSIIALKYSYVYLASSSDCFKIIIQLSTISLRLWMQIYRFCKIY